MAIKRGRMKVRKPVAKKATRPMDTRKGSRGYSRRRQARDLRRKKQEYENDE